MTRASALRLRAALHVGPLHIDVDLDTGPGTLVIVGPNGAGKTSVLSAVLGVLPIERGHLSVGEQVLFDSETRTNVPVERRRLGYLPQDDVLFPHLSVRENVAFALESAPPPRPRATRAEQAAAVLRELELQPFADRSTRSLSGGEKQRVALARALAVGPRALLLDEPMAALDPQARRAFRSFLAAYLEARALPAIVVTHDPADARALGHTIAVLENGKVIQRGTWQQIAATPRSRFVEDFTASD